MTSSVFHTLSEYLDAGGAVMWPLLIGALVLWYAIGYRAVSLRRGTMHSVRDVVRSARDGRVSKPHGVVDAAAVRAVAVERVTITDLDRVLDSELFSHFQELKKGRTVINGIVTVAPLVGLLGTVAGMIETFDSLGDMTLFAQSGGIAGGISQALFSTQMGLCVAIPGVIVGRLLDRRQEALEDELEQIKAMVGGTRT